MKIKITGKIDAINKKDFEGAISYQLQFIVKSEKGISIVNLKTNKNTYKVGDEVSIDTSYSVFENKIYFKEID